jgi:hypothetical protein
MVDSKFDLATTKSGDLVAEEIEEGIYVIKNALTPDEIRYLHDIAESTTEEGWRIEYLDVLTRQAIGVYGESDTANIKEYIERNYNEYWSNKIIRLSDEAFCNNIVNRIRPFFGEKYDVSNLYEIQRQTAGEGLDEHFDGGFDARLLRAVIFYINDDFSGGELYFPKKNFQYKPTAGDFITFPSPEEYLHGVRTVGDGPSRYAMAGFAWESGKMYEWIKDH